MAEPVPIECIDGVRQGGFTLDLHLPESVDSENMYVHTGRLTLAAAAAGSANLHITTESGPVSERRFGVYMDDSDWQPGLRNLFYSGRNVPLLRTVGAHESEQAEGADWIVINRNELFDRIQEEEFAQTQRWRGQLHPEDYPGRLQSFTWSEKLNTAIGQGVRELSRMNTRRNPLLLGLHIGAAALSRRTFIEAREPKKNLTIILLDLEQKPQEEPALQSQSEIT